MATVFSQLLLIAMTKVTVYFHSRILSNDCETGGDP
jgi:hypothetical protein